MILKQIIYAWNVKNRLYDTINCLYPKYKFLSAVHSRFGWWWTTIIIEENAYTKGVISWKKSFVKFIAKWKLFNIPENKNLWDFKWKNIFLWIKNLSHINWLRADDHKLNWLFHIDAYHIKNVGSASIIFYKLYIL